MTEDRLREALRAADDLLATIEMESHVPHEDRSWGMDDVRDVREQIRKAI